MQFTTFRLANYETPLWATANLTLGRYNGPRAPATQYLSLHPMTPWAEVLRAEDRRAEGRALHLRYPLWVIKVELDEDPLEITFDNAGRYGLSPDELVADDWTACHQFADSLRDDDVSAFIAPSAALPGTRNLVILAPAVSMPYEAEPLGPEDLPAAMAAQNGHCPHGLWTLVHYRGAPTPHAAYDAWRAGDDFELEEPEVTPSTLLV